MNRKVIVRLIAKDCSLMRVPLAAYTSAAVVATILAAAGAKSAGITLALNVLVGVSFHVMLGLVLSERSNRTLAFVMSLPVTPRDYAIGKMLSSFVLFLVSATIAATALVFLSPIDIFASMAASDRSILSHLAGWGAFYALVLGAWVWFFSIVLAAAIVTESIGWTIAVLTGSIFVVGNAAIQILPSIGWFGRYVKDLAHGGMALPVTLSVEAAGIALVVAVMLTLQGRKTSFV